MDTVLSARVDDAVHRHLTLLARRLGTSKKAVLERAIRELAERLDLEEPIDPLEHTHGIWNRGESPEETAAQAGEPFQRSMTRRSR